MPELEQDARADTARRARAAVLTALAELGGESRRQPLLARAVAEGGFTERELAAPAPLDTRARYESEVVYRLSRALHQLKREGLLETPSWNVWRLAEMIARSPEPALAEAHPEQEHRVRASIPPPEAVALSAGDASFSARPPHRSRLRRFFGGA